MRQAVQRMVAARRAGLGMYLSEWQLTVDDAATGGIESLVDPIVAWCRDTIARCRRPYGIDHFDLALAFSLRDGTPVQSTQFRDLRPADLYDEDGFAGRLAQFLVSKRAATTDGTAVLHIAGALFSWGDAAHAALPMAS
jgi:hypothetical protein